MAPLTPAQQAWRDRFETGIGLMTPLLDLVLVAGERLSRLVGPDDDWEPPTRPTGARRPRPAAAPGED